jgi:hypothetical protein
MLTTPYVLAVLLAIAGSEPQYRFEQQVRAAEQIKHGDSEARVLEILGPPHNRWKGSIYIFGGSLGPPQWIYGTDIVLGRIVNPDFPIPNLFPFQLRIFTACEDDLVIKWSANRRVAGVERL